MKREDLLEAVGFVEENLLLESEERQATGRTSVWFKAAVAAAAVLLMSVTAIAAVKLLSKPVKNGGVAVGTVSPFDMDGAGNIVLEPVTGWQVTMDVEFDDDAPEVLEEVYRMLPSARWDFKFEAVRDDDLQEDRENRIIWTHADRPGQLRLSQYCAGYYGLEGDRVVDCLHGLALDTKVKAEIVTMANLQMLRVTIPPAKIEGMLDQNAMYCEEGEVRLYWSDGKYLLELDHPLWVPEKEVEAMLGSLFTVKHMEVYPEHWGKIAPERIAALNPAFVLSEEKTGTTAVNDIMTVGMMAREGNMLYLSADGGIFKYDIATGSSAFMETEENSLPRNLFLTEHYVCYTDYLYNRYGLYLISKDGTKRDYVYEGISLGSMRVVGTKLYGVHGKELKCIDLESGKITTLAENVNTFYVDGQDLYVLPYEGNYFLKSDREFRVLEKTELSFRPIAMVKNGEELFFTVGGTPAEEQRRYQVVRYANGEEINLPIYSVRMQFLDGKLLYEADPDSSVVKCYDPETGETKPVQENVFDFYVCDDGMVVFHYLYNDGWGIWNSQNGEVKPVENYPG